MSAAQRRRAFIERIERLEEERQSLADDIADVYDELKADGHDKAAIKIIVKIRRKEDGLAKWVGHSGTVDEYLADLGMLPKHEEARAGARVRENIEQFPPHDPETGELTQTQEQPETASQSGVGPVDPDTSLAAREADESAAHFSPSPASAPRLTIADDEAAQAQTSSAPITNPQPTSSPAVDMAGEPQDRNEPVSGSSATPFNNPKCKNPFGCSHAHDRGSCNDCFFSWAKLPLDEQRRLLADAMEAAEMENA